MRLKRTRLSLLVVVLVFSAQITAAPTAARAAAPQDHGQHGQHNRGQRVGIPDSRCRRRYNSNYRLCLRRGKNRKACLSQLRNCQRRCPQ